MRKNQSMLSLSVLLMAAAACLPGARADGQCADDTPIFDIQGASHVSALDGQSVVTCGVVTAVAFNGYYLQDSMGDGLDETSDGIFVSTRDELPPVGSIVTVQAAVSELIPGGAASGNLSTTTLVDVVELDRQAPVALPTPVLIGAEGRSPSPTTVISDSEIGEGINLQLAEDAAMTPFNPDDDAIDFMESLEGMRVSVVDPLAVSAVRQFGTFSAEVFVVADGGAGVVPSDALNSRGGLGLQPHPDNRGDQNPERLQIQFDGTLYGSTDYPAISVGDRLETVTGVMGYSFGNYEINATMPVTVNGGNLSPERSLLTASDTKLLVASYNVLNLSAVEADDAQRELIARQIVDALNAPDIIALQEIQDNNGDIGDCQDDLSVCSDVLDASETLQSLIDAILAAGGPAYAYIDVAPLVETTDDNRDDIDTFGGASLGNIRNAYLYNPERVSLIEYLGLTRDELGVRDISVPNAFDSSRDPLAATFDFQGQSLTLLNNHFSSRFGSTPIFGGPQPFVQAGAAERTAQAQAMHELTAGLLAEDPQTPVMVLGDLNTFEFTTELAQTLSSASGTTLLHNLIDSQPSGEAYSYIFEGNAQALDHVFVSDGLLERASIDYVNVNVDFPRLFDSIVASDHEPLLVRLSMEEVTEPSELTLSGEVYSSTALELFWNYAALTDTPAGVNVYRNEQLIASHDGRSHFQEGLTPGTDYLFRVEALDREGRIVAENSIQLATRDAGGAHSASGVSALTGTVYSTTAIELFWQPPADSVAGFDYEIFRDGALVARHDGRSHFEMGLAPGTTHNYAVVAVDRQGVSRPAVLIAVETPPEP